MKHKLLKVTLGVVAAVVLVFAGFGAKTLADNYWSGHADVDAINTALDKINGQLTAKNTALATAKNQLTQAQSDLTTAQQDLATSKAQVTAL
ncbi:hypothetical protein [Loigolactobacillus zhaoyuanensis]|nr:hypothetical protein [Loigolactobacillus zhaoyuanensis]